LSAAYHRRLVSRTLIHSHLPFLAPSSAFFCLFFSQDRKLIHVSVGTRQPREREAGESTPAPSTTPGTRENPVVIPGDSPSRSASPSQQHSNQQQRESVSSPSEQQQQQQQQTTTTPGRTDSPLGGIASWVRSRFGGGSQ